MNSLLTPKKKRRNINLKTIVMQKIFEISKKGINLIETPKKESDNNTLLPLTLSQDLFDFFLQIRDREMRRSPIYDQTVFNTFKNSSMCPITKVCIFKVVGITTQTLTHLLKANTKITHLEICLSKMRFDKELWSSINSLTSLKTLKLDYVFGTLKCPNLKSLFVFNIIWDWVDYRYLVVYQRPRTLAKYLKLVIQNLICLEIFYETYAVKHYQFNSITAKPNKNKRLELKMLHLHLAQCNQNMLVNSIIKLKELRKLYIKFSCNYNNPENFLLTIKKAKLPLVELSILGTQRVVGENDLGEIDDYNCCFHTFHQFIDLKTKEYVSRMMCGDGCPHTPQIYRY